MRNPPVKLLDRVRQRIRLKGYSIRTEKTYVSWTASLKVQVPLGFFYVLPEVDGFLAVLFFEIPVPEGWDRVYVGFGKLLKIGIGNCIFKLNSPWP